MKEKSKVILDVDGTKYIKVSPETVLLVGNLLGKLKTFKDAQEILEYAVKVLSDALQNVEANSTEEEYLRKIQEQVERAIAKLMSEEKFSE
ncbi:MAG: hypothetical protein QXP36_00135 [Conexivisphaerales archaeon]